KHIEFLKQIKANAERNKQVFILAINKIDELKDKSALLDLITQYSKQLPDIEIIPLSATKHDGLQNLFDTLNKAARPAEFMFNPDFFTDASEKEIVAALIRTNAILDLM